MNPIHFPGQKESEDIKFLIRKHWIIYLKLGMFMMLMVGVPFAIYLLLEISFGFSANTKEIITLFFLLYLDGVLLMGFIRWIEEEMDILLVTNERLINIDQVSFMHRTISETELSQIQDVHYRGKGVLSNVFGFGVLEIQTAADKIVFRIEDVPKPFLFARRIMDLRNAYVERHQPQSSLHSEQHNSH